MIRWVSFQCKWWVTFRCNLTPRYLNDADIVEAASSGTQIHDDIEVLLKGPEIPLPKGVSFKDKDGNIRHRIRIKWWNTSLQASYPDLAMVPSGEADNLPDCRIAGSLIRHYEYGSAEPPVFFGHYWLTGTPAPIGPNLVCLDYSAGKGGKLMAYHWREGDTGPLIPERFVTSA